MSKTAKIVVALSLVAFVAACAKKEQPMPMQDQPMVTAEPTYNKV